MLLGGAFWFLFKSLAKADAGRFDEATFYLVVAAIFGFGLRETEGKRRSGS